MEKSALIPRSPSAARFRFVRLVVFFLLASLLTQANVSPAGSAASNPPTPPSEKLLAEWGQWETEYWDDSGQLSFRYVGDPNPTVQPAGGQGLPDFVIGTRTLLTAIIDVHVNPNTDAIHVEDTGSPGTLALVDDVGNQYGPFAAERGGVAVNNGKAEATILWVALVDHVELPPGRYWVHDSDPSSLLSNAQTFNVGATLAKGVDAKAYEKYMDALVAANEPEPVAQPAPDNSGGNTDIGGTNPTKVTYSNPQPVVNNPPDPTLATYPPNNPALYCEFVTDKPMMVTKIMDYHINDGKGAQPGRIGLQEHGGTMYGSWPAYGQSYNGIPNAIWVVTPNFEIPAGSYKVMDNQFSTLSEDANNRAMCVVNIAPTITSPIDNVTGKYFIGFSDDDGTTLDYTLVLAVIDHKNTLEIGAIIEDQPFKFDASVTERANGVVKAEFRQGFPDFSIIVRMTFTKKPDRYVLTGRVTINAAGESSGISFSGARTSTDLPGFIPKPPAGIGKVGSIPGPGSTAQAVAGIAFPTLATLIAAGAFSGGKGGGGGSSGSSQGSYGGEAADGGGAGTAEGEGGSGEASEEGGGDAGDADTGSPGTGDADTGSPDTGSPGTGGADTSSPDTGSAVQSQPAIPVPPPVAAHPPQVGPQDGQTMSVHDSGDGLDKTYVYDANAGEWINPLTGGMYVAANYAASAQAQAETDAEIKKRALADANALADGPTKWIPGSDATKVASPLTAGVVAAAVASAGSTIPPAPAASGTTAVPAASSTTPVPAAPGAASTSATIPPVPTAPGSGKAGSTPAPQQGPTKMIRQGIIDMKADLEVINKRLADENIYVINKFQRTNLLLDGVAKAGNTVWDYTAGWVTGSTGLTCEGYVNKTMAGVKEAVNKQFPGAKVEQAVFLEKSTYKPEGILDNLDALNNDNHTFTKVTLPDGSEWAVDFHGHNSSNLPTNPPIMRPYDEVRQEWKKYMGNEFMES